MWQQPFTTMISASPAIKRILIVIFLIAFSLLVSIMVTSSARHDAEKWLQGLTPKAQPQIESFSQVQATEIERFRLQDQLHLIRERANHHLTVSVYFFSNYYMAIIQAFVMGGIAAVALFSITKVGYSQANQNVVTVFVTSTALATIYGAFPSVFRQSDNVSENKMLYLKYIAMQNDMLTYAATGLNSSLKKATAAEFISFIDKELNNTNNVAIGFDATKIPAVKFDLK